MRKEVGTVGDLVGRFAVYLHCSCGHSRRFEAARMAAWYGAELPNRSLVARAKCSNCGGRAQGMTIEPTNAHGYASLAR